MYAVIDVKGKQYCVEEGQLIVVDRNDVQPGESIEYDRVLLVGGTDEPTVGTPTVQGAKVVAQVVEHFRDKKIHVQTFKRRKNLKRHLGHRQPMTQVKIEQIVLG